MQADLHGVIVEEWVVLTVVCVLVNRGCRVEVVQYPGTGVPVEPGEVEATGEENRSRLLFGGRGGVGGGLTGA